MPDQTQQTDDIVVTTPDGTEHHFPSTATREQISAVLNKQTASQPEQADQTRIGPPVSWGRQLLNAAIETGPQNVFKKENLPVIAAALTTPFTAGMGAVPIIAAGALAGGAGEATRQAVSGEDPNAMGVVKEGAKQGAMLAGGELINAGIAPAATAFKESAQKSVAQALGATKEWAKSEAGKLAPEILERGVSGTRPGMLAEATSQVKELGPKIGQIYKDAAAQGSTVSGPQVRAALQQERASYQVPDATGKMTTVPGAERAVRQLNKLENWVASLGDDIPVDKAFQVRKIWDRIVNKAGLFGQKVSASATDSADAYVYREGRTAFQKLLNDVNPDISALNKEFSFWKGLQGVLKETQARTQSQEGGLLDRIAGSAGGAVSGLGAHMSGLGYGESMEAAALGGWATKQFSALMRSPYWRTTVSGPMKNALANALASGNMAIASQVQKSILNNMPAVVRTTLERTPVQSLTPALAAQDDSTTPTAGSAQR